MDSIDQNELFGRLERKPFGGDSIGLSDADAGRDIHADPSGIAQDVGFPAYLVDFIARGFANGSFFEGPPDGNGSVIDDEENKLPGWSLVNNNTDEIVVTWDGTNHSVVFTCSADVTTADDAYLEQYIPMSNASAILAPRYFFQNDDYDADYVEARLRTTRSNWEQDTFDTEYEVIRNDGTAGPSAWSGTLAALVHPGAASTRGWLRVRIGPHFAQDLDAEYVFTVVSAEEASRYLGQATLHAGRDNLSPASATDYTLAFHDLALSPSRWIAPHPGWVVSWWGATNDSIGAGDSVRGYLHNVTTGTKLAGGPILYNSPTRDVYNRTMDGDEYFDFDFQDEVAIGMRTNSGFNSTGSADYLIGMHLLYLRDVADLS